VRVRSVRVRNFRAFEDSGALDLGAINVIVGPNNAGKSSLIRALALLQEGLPLGGGDVRLGTDASTISMEVEEIASPWPERPDGTVDINLSSQGGFSIELGGPSVALVGVNRFPNSEPTNFIYPFFSGRKVAAYEPSVTQNTTLAVGPDLRHLPAKLARLSNPDFPAHGRYREACEAVLGFVVTAIPAPNGQQAGVYVGTGGASIPMEAMGEGVANVVGLLVDLTLAQGKLFLVEEPENDIHPQALKALLDRVVESSSRNQFVVSTHSHIVVRHLGSPSDARVVYVESEGLPPIASIRALDSTAERIEVLSDLGYDLWDFDLWEGWLILEESSAERILRDLLIPWFAPQLARVRTVSAGGQSGVPPTFDDFNRLFRFTHLEERYRDRAWVIVDGDAEGHRIVEQLRGRYTTWDPRQFRTWREEDFEHYYPSPFAGRVATTLALSGRAKREAKATLLTNVLDCSAADEQGARDLWAESAAEVIEVLTEIERQLI